MPPTLAKRHAWRLVFRRFEESLEPLHRLPYSLPCNEFALRLSDFSPSCRIDLEELQDATDRVEVRTGCSYRPMPFALRLRKFRASLSVV